MKKKQREFYPKKLTVKPQRIQNVALAIPKLEYKVVAQPILKTEFTGHVTTVPTVLIFYLNNLEFKIIATIIQETIECGVCLLNAKQFAVRLSTNTKRIYDELYKLRKMGLLYEDRQGRSVARAVDFKTVQHLNDLLGAEDRGVYRRLRNRMKLRNIRGITKEDLKLIYDKYVLPVDHDPEEEEEYD